MPTVSRSLPPELRSVHVRAVEEPGRRPDAWRAIRRHHCGPQRRAVRRTRHGASGRRRHGDQNGGPRDPQGPYSKAKADVRVSAGVQPLWETAGGSQSGQGRRRDARRHDACRRRPGSKAGWIERLGLAMTGFHCCPARSPDRQPAGKSDRHNPRPHDLHRQRCGRTWMADHGSGLGRHARTRARARVRSR